MILRLGCQLCVMAVLAVLLSACDVFAAGSSINDIVLTTALDADYCPVDEVTTFPTDRPFYCSAQVSNLRAGSTVTFRWYFGEQFIEEASYRFESSGSGCASHEMKCVNPCPWPRGGYRVEVYLDGHFERSTTFAVR